MQTQLSSDDSHAQNKEGRPITLMDRPVDIRGYVERYNPPREIVP